MTKLTLNTLPNVLLAESLSYVPTEIYTDDSFYRLFRVSKHFNVVLHTERHSWFHREIHLDLEDVEFLRRIMNKKRKAFKKFIKFFLESYKFITSIRIPLQVDIYEIQVQACVDWAQLY